MKPTKSILEEDIFVSLVVSEAALRLTQKKNGKNTFVCLFMATNISMKKVMPKNYMTKSN